MFNLKTLITSGIVLLSLLSSIATIGVGYNITPKKEYDEIVSASGPIDSPWPMYCHDTRHTGRSPYSIADNTGKVKWRYNTGHWVDSDPVIDTDGTIYFGSGLYFYALNSDGSFKWKYKIHSVVSAPAIDESGIIYVGTAYDSGGNHLYALYPNGTLKWKFPTSSQFSSPAIADDGTIIFADSENWNIKALYPNGTQKWSYHTNHVVYSEPAIGLDGTVYCGSHDGYLYALNPDNGSLLWKFKTGNWVAAGPCIADDGTVYFGSWDGYLYACYPNNGTLKWKSNAGSSTTPVIAEDGTIYVASQELTAVYPNNGTIKWIFGSGGTTTSGNPCISSEGIIVYAIGEGYVIAVNPDGTQRWRTKIATEVIYSAPCIGEDGTIYIGTCDLPEYGDGYLYAIARPDLDVDANGPYYGLVDTPLQFMSTSKGGYPPYSWYWDFGDGETSDEENPYHTFENEGNYTVTVTITDNTGNQSTDTTFAWIQIINNPPTKPSISGPSTGKPWEKYCFSFRSENIDDTGQYWLFIDWGDGYNTGWYGPYKSGQMVNRTHNWQEKGKFLITARAKDIYESESEQGYFNMKISRVRPRFDFNMLDFLDHFPIINNY